MRICFHRRNIKYIIALIKNNSELQVILAMFVLLVLTMTFGLAPSSIYDIKNDYPDNLLDVYCGEVTDITVSRYSMIAYPYGINVFWKDTMGFTNGRYSISSAVLESSVLDVASELEELIGKTIVVSGSRSNDGVLRIRGIEHDGKFILIKTKHVKQVGNMLLKL